MRTSRQLAKAVAALAVIAALCTITGPTQPRAANHFTSQQDALDQGLQAYSAGNYKGAVPALDFAARKGHFWAQFFLARIYGDAARAPTDHGKAYDLYFEIVKNNIDMDTLDRRAGGFGQVLTAFGRYIKTGVPSIDLQPNPGDAVIYLREAAVSYGNQDAQFELAKMYLSGEGPDKNVIMGQHMLKVLSDKGHAGAQALLAEILAKRQR